MQEEVFANLLLDRGDDVVVIVQVGGVVERAGELAAGKAEAGGGRGAEDVGGNVEAVVGPAA